MCGEQLATLMKATCRGVKTHLRQLISSGAMSEVTHVGVLECVAVLVYVSLCVCMRVYVLSIHTVISECSV